MIDFDFIDFYSSYPQELKTLRGIEDINNPSESDYMKIVELDNDFKADVKKISIALKFYVNCQLPDFFEPSKFDESIKYIWWLIQDPAILGENSSLRELELVCPRLNSEIGLIYEDRPIVASLLGENIRLFSGNNSHKITWDVKRGFNEPLNAPRVIIKGQNFKTLNMFTLGGLIQDLVVENYDFARLFIPHSKFLIEKTNSIFRVNEVKVK